jgi:hypothetical protein
MLIGVPGSTLEATMTLNKLMNDTNKRSLFAMEKGRIGLHAVC